MPRLVAGTAVERTSDPKTSQGFVALSGANQQIIAANKDRVALIFSHHGASPVFLALGGGAIVDRGIRLTNAMPPFVLTHWTGTVNVIGTAAEVLGWAELGA